MLAASATRRPLPIRPRVALAAALGVACALPAIPVAAASAAAVCTPPGMQRSATIARAQRPDGTSEVTEFEPTGEYRITRCGRDGGLQVSETVSPIATPDGTMLVPTERQQPGVTVSAVYGDPADPGWAAAFRAALPALKAEVIAPTTPPPAGTVPIAPVPGTGDVSPDPLPAPSLPAMPSGPAAPVKPAKPVVPPTPSPGGGGGEIVQAAVAGDACTNGQYKFSDGSWPGRSYSYSINRSRFNYNDTTVDSIVDGHTNWDTTYNSCGFSDITNLTSHYLGSTSDTVHSNPDGESITDKGDLSSFCPGALACTWQFDDVNGRAIETDQRFNQDFTFSNVGAAGAYDYESVATHESGHSIGLDHATSSDALTMYPQIPAGTTYVRSLARGDVLGLRARYP